MNRDAAFGCAGLLLAAGYYALATRVPESQLADAVGPQGLPKAYAVVLAALSVALIASSLRRREAAAVAGARHAHLRAAGMLAFGVAYVALVSWLGYAASIAALILAVAWYHGGALTRRVVLVSLGGAAFFWLLFVALLRVPHPRGIWGPLF